MSYFIHAEIDHYQQFEYLFINHSMTKENSEQAMTLFCTFEKPQSSMANQSQNKEVIFIISVCCSCLCNNSNNDNNNDNKTMQFISIFFPFKDIFWCCKKCVDICQDESWWLIHERSPLWKSFKAQMQNQRFTLGTVL